jgi:4-azaleucine resistance transporter AzlC
MLRVSSPRSHFLSGVRAEIPILLGVIPFGIIYGVLAVEAKLPLSLAQSMSFIIFAGSAQFITVQLIREGAASLVIIATVFIVNLRHMLYSASLAPHVAHLPNRWKWLLAYLLTDEAYAVVITKYNDQSDPQYKHWYFLGAGLALWVTWQLSTAFGVFLGDQAQIDGSLGLDFAIAVTFIALVIPAIKDWAVGAAAFTGGVVAVVAAPLPYNLNLMLAAFTGIAAGVMVEYFTRRKLDTQS